MEISALTKELLNPGKNPISKEDLNELKALYPYYSLLHYYEARKHYIHQDFHYNQSIKIASAYSPNRKKLYDYLHKDYVETQTVETQKTSATNTSSNEEIKKLEELLKEIKSELHSIVESPTLVNEIGASPIENKSIGEEITSIIPETIPAENEFPTTSDSQVNTKENQAIEASNLASAEQNNDEALSDFTKWLKTVKHSGVNQASAKQDKATENAQIPEKDKQSALIEKFIAEEPRIVPKKGVFFSPTTNAKQSVTEDEELITETLARVFELQKNYKKAISAYERLSLKFPEKSAYFAAQIENIKKKLNSN